MGLIELVLPPGAMPDRVDKVLARLLPDTSRGTVQRWIEEERVRVNGKPCRARDRVGAGAMIAVDPGPRLTSEAVPEVGVEFGILFEDEHLVVVDKPAGLVVHPARGHWTGTLVNGLLGRTGVGEFSADPRDPTGHLRPGVVHRLDKDTSGVLVVAKDERTREGLKEQLSSHTVERLYRAITLGIPRPGRIATLHGRHPTSRLRFTSLLSEGREAVTDLCVSETLAGGRAALVECRLQTGRTHQIRVHLAEQAKTPVFADALYGKVPLEAELLEIHDALGRQALHAAVLGFIHPITGERHRFESALPADLAQALQRLRALQ